VRYVSRSTSKEFKILLGSNNWSLRDIKRGAHVVMVLMSIM